MAAKRKVTGPSLEVNDVEIVERWRRILWVPRCRNQGELSWVLVREFYLSYHNKEAMFFPIDPDYGSLN